MKSKTVGIFTDTHGNLLALNAILDFFDSKKVSKIYHLGDIVSMGPCSVECMEIFKNRAEDIVCLLGNHDNDYLNDNTVPPELSHVTGEHKKFVFGKLGDKYRPFVDGLPTVIVQNFFGLRVAFMHYGMARDEDIKKNPKAVFRPIEEPSVESFDAMYQKIPADIVFFGHKHSPVDMVGQKVYCDVGSVGCHKGNFARGVLFTVNEDKTYSIERVQVPYDRQKTFKKMEEEGLPNAKFIQDFYFMAD